MIIGSVKEIKEDEYRVGISPESARALVALGHDVLIEKDAGLGSGFSNQMYQDVGASIIDNSHDVYRQVQLMVKVKEPLKNEYDDLRENQMLFTYLHLAADETLTKVLLDKKVTAIAYETIQYQNQGLPLLKPMSVIAGRLAVQQGAKYLEKTYGGKGIILSGVDGANPAEVMIVGTGNVARNAIYMAYGMGANVSVVGTNTNDLEMILKEYPSRLHIYQATKENIEKIAMKADLVILSALVVGGKAPLIISLELLKKMQAGSVIVDVSVDQGGCAESTRPTTHKDPIYIEEGIVHYAVSNMPGCVPRSASLALNHATLPYIIEIANKGLVNSVMDNEAIYKGVNTYQGHLVYEAVGQAFGIETQPLKEVL